MLGTPKTLIDKIWEAHVVEHRADGRDLLYMDRHIPHEIHASHAFEKLHEAGRQVRRPDLTFSVQDHLVSTKPGRTEDSNPNTAPLIHAMREGSRRNGIRLFGLGDAEQGISHVVGPELGLVLPGATHACPDSHACTVGGLGALAFGCGTTEMEHILATQTLVLKKPKRMRITLDGILSEHVTAKDVALHVIRKIGMAGGRGFVVEYAGPVARSLSIEARLTLCNLIIEMGARTGLIAPDDTVFQYVAGLPWAPHGTLWDQALAQWRDLVTDDDATFDQDLAIDCSPLTPQITWGTDPSQTIGIDEAVPELADDEGRQAAQRRALDYMGLQPGKPISGMPVDRVFIGSCTNSRLSDLEIAAAIVRGRKVAPGVTALVVPGSTKVKQDAEARGLDKVFQAAGFAWGESGCSMCAAANGDVANSGERCISTTNRNFENRQGRGVRTHLSSPAMAAAAAVTGRIVDVRRLTQGGL